MFHNERSLVRSTYRRFIGFPYETSIRTYFVSVESVFEGNPCKNEEIKHLVIIPGGPSGLLRPGGDGEEEARKSEKITYLSHKINCTKLILFRYFARASSSFPKRIRHTARGTSPKKKDTMAPRRKSPTREILPRTGQRRYFFFKKKFGLVWFIERFMSSLVAGFFYKHVDQRKAFSVFLSPESMHDRDSQSWLDASLRLGALS